MNTKRICLWAVSLYSFAISQGAFLDKNMSGFNAGASIYGQTDKSYAGQIQLGYTQFGIFDFNIAFGPGKTYQTKDGINGPQKYFAFSPGFSAYIAKQDSQMPISLALDFSYENDAYRSHYFDGSDFGLSGDVYSLGFSLYKLFPVSNNFKLAANVKASYRMERDAMDNGWRYYSRSYNDYPHAAVGIDALFKESNNSSLRIGAGIGYDRNNDKDNFTVSTAMSIEIGWLAKIRKWYYPRRYYIVPAENVVVVPRNNTIQPSKSDSDTLIVNVPLLKGGSVSVKLVRYKDGYVGPQGEFYAGKPNMEQLKVLYGD